MSVVVAKEAVLHTGHEDRRTLGTVVLRQRREGKEHLALEFPLVVLDQLVSLGWIIDLGVILAIDERVGRRERDGSQELRTVARVDRVINRVTLQTQIEADLVADAVGYVEVPVVVHMIQLIAQREHGVEIVVGPIKTLTETYTSANHFDVLRWVVGLLIGIVTIASITIATVDAVVVEAVGHVAAVFLIKIAGIITRVLGIIEPDRECVRALATEPRVEEGEAIGLIVFTTRLAVDGKRLAVALGDNAAVGAGVEEVAHGEVVELQTDAPKQSARSPSGR